MKNKNNFMTLILSMVAILVLLIPAYSTYSIESNQVTHVLAIQGLYTNGTDINIYEPFNNSALHLTYGFDVRTQLTPQANNDSLIMGFNHSGVHNKRRVGQLQNDISYIGNGTYSVSVDWANMPDSWFGQGRQIIIELNITGNDAINYDWLKLTHSQNGTPSLAIFQSSAIQYYQLLETSNTEAIYTIGISAESYLNEKPNNHIFLVLGSKSIEQFADNPTSFTFKIEGYNFSPADSPTFTDQSYYVMSLIISDFIFLIAIVFTSQPFDIKIDKRGK